MYVSFPSTTKKEFLRFRIRVNRLHDALSGSVRKYESCGLICGLFEANTNGEQRKDITKFILHLYVGFTVIISNVLTRPYRGRGISGAAELRPKCIVEPLEE